MYNTSIHVSTGVRILEVLALLFVISAGCIALAIVLPIALWHEQQAAIVGQATATYRPRYTRPVPMYAVFQVRPIPSSVPKRLIVERWVYA
jgi:hypothetical protein